MRRFLKTLLVGVILLTGSAASIYAQHARDSVTVYFRQGLWSYDSDFRDNGSRVNDFISRIQLTQMLSDKRICRVDYISSASPEGPESYNQTLAQRRAKSMTDVLHNRLDFADSLVHLTAIPEDWDRLVSMIRSDVNVPDRKAALKIAESSDPQRKQKLMELGGGAAWEYLLANHYPDLRSFRIFIYIGDEAPVLEGVMQVDLSSEPIVASEPAPAPVPVSVPLVKADSVAVADTVAKLDSVPKAIVAVQPAPVVKKTVKDWVPNMKIKTNLLGWGALMTNLAIEVELIRNLSFALPVYYSGWDCFNNHRLKFRTLTIQPEIRYYIPRTKGLYLGVHGGVGYWNIADNGDWRYQDQDGKNPAVGGGLSVGYALQFKKNPRWGMEFAVGGGVYDVKYDIFYNEENGPYHKRAQRMTWMGVDNATISFTYKFDLKKGGNK